MANEWPEWWDWELDLSLPHLLKRMVDRGFNDVDLRTMLDDAHGWYQDHVEGRYAIETRLRGVPWLVIVEPQSEDWILLVITAYPEE